MNAPQLIALTGLTGLTPILTTLPAWSSETDVAGEGDRPAKSSTHTANLLTQDAITAAIKITVEF